jgi:hypothetical protein
VQWVVYAAAATLVIFGVRWLLRTAFPNGVLAANAPAEAPQTEAVQEWPKCVVCGDDATEARPIVTTGRPGSADNSDDSFIVRSYESLVRLVAAPYALTPLYRRQTPKAQRVEDLCFCRCCAPTADAKIDRFLMSEVRAPIAKANEEAAVAIARFMREELIASMRNDLQGGEKKASVPPTLSSVPRLPLRSSEKLATGTE